MFRSVVSSKGYNAFKTLVSPGKYFDSIIIKRQMNTRALEILVKDS